MNCKYCGAKNPDNTRFCGHCAAPLRSENKKLDVSTSKASLPLGTSGIYQIVKLWDYQYIDTEEYTNNLLEASARLDYLNGRSWKAVYMVRKVKS